VSYQTKKTKTISVKLGELPGSTSPLASNEKNSRVDALGMELSPSQKGLEVVRVLPGSKAALSGLKPRDRIKSAGRKQVHSVSEFQNLVDKGKSIGLVVERDKRELFLVLNS
jgi:serine protease Do